MPSANRSFSQGSVPITILGFAFATLIPAGKKGNVERKVHYNRSNLFVPVPHFTEVEAYNRKLLLRHEKKEYELHYKKQIPIRELFEEDHKALLVLPSKSFNVCRYEWLKADGYGKVCLGGKHFYSTMPENAHKKVLIGIRAHAIDILTQGEQEDFRGGTHRYQ